MIFKLQYTAFSMIEYGILLKNFTLNLIYNTKLSYKQNNILFVRIHLNYYLVYSILHEIILSGTIVYNDNYSV